MCVLLVAKVPMCILGIDTVDPFSGLKDLEKNVIKKYKHGWTEEMNKKKTINSQTTQFQWVCR